MSKKSFLKSATLAIAGVVLASGLSSCKAWKCKHGCASKDGSVKEEKAHCSSKGKEGKAHCSSKMKAKKAEKKAEKAAE